MTKGNSKKLKVSIKPASLKKTVTYQSKNKKVVTVSKSGKLKAKKVGTAKIMVTVRTKGNKGTTKKTWLKIKVVKKKKTTNKKDNTDNNISEDNNSKPNDTTNTTPSNDNNSNKSENDVISYTVIFDLNYNTGGTYQTVSVPSGEKVAQPENPTRSGYTFDDWYTDTVGGQKFDFNTAITVNTTLYAHWNQISSNGGVSSGTMGSGNGSGGNNNENTNNIEITGIAIVPNNTTVTDKVKSGDVLTYVTTPVNATGTITWTVGGTTIEQQSYTVTDMDAGKTIIVSITGTGNYIGTQKSKACTVDNTIVFNNKATDPDKNPVVVSKSAVYKTSDGKEITLDSSAKLNLTIQSSNKQSSDKDIIEMKKAVMEHVVGNQDNAEDMKDLTVTALDVDLNLVKTTSEGTTETTEIHPVGETVVTLSASQLGLEGQDISLYYFAAKHKNIDGTEETVRSECKELNGTQYIRFTLNGLSTIWFGNIPPRTVTFDTDGGTTVASQKVKFGSCVNTALIEQPTQEGYLFCGWNYDLAKTPIISNLTVKAIWIKGEQMPVEQYTVEFTEGTDAAFTLKKTDGRITFTLLPEKEIQPNLSYTITVNPFHGATKYVTGADAKTVTSNHQYLPLDGNKLQIKGEITNREGKVNTGTTIAYYKWAGAEDTVLALHEIAITIDDGSGTAEKMDYNANVNRGIGTYEAYLLDKDGGENAREPFVAYMNGNLSSSGSYEKGYDLITNAGFDSYRVNNDLKGYDTVELQFSPFEGKSYHESDTINVSANSHFDGISTEQETEYKITEDGKLMITISLKDLGDDTTWGMNVYLYVNVTVNDVTQNINVNIQKYAERNKKYFETDNWNEVVSKLSEGEAYDIHYMGSDVTLTSSLTIPANCHLAIRNANLTVGKGAVLTLDAEVKNVAGIEMSQGTFTVADGGILTTVSQPKSYYRADFASNAVVIQNGGQIINPENGVLGLWGVNTSSSFTVESGAIIKNSGDIVIRNFNEITMNGTIDSTSYAYIYGNTITIGGTIKQSKNRYLQLYGEIIITKTGSLLIDAANNMFYCYLISALNNQGTIQVTNGNVSLSNTRYSVYNSGTISIDSGIIYVRGTKLINTGTIRGMGTLQCLVSAYNTNYDNGIEYISVPDDQYWNSELQQTIYKTEDYSRYKYTHDPANNVDVILYKSEVINEGSGTCAAKIDTEEFPEKNKQ